MTLLRHLIIFLLPILILTPGLRSQTSAADFIPLTNISQDIATPMRIAVDAQDNIYVADVVQKCILKYNAGGNLVATLAQGSYPVSVAISPDGDLYYGDGKNGIIYNLGGGGEKEEFYTEAHYPSSMAFSPDHVLYVADNELKKVLAIDLSGDLVGTIGEGQLVFPTGIAFDSKNDRILVAEHGGIGGEVMSMGWWGRAPLITVHMFDRQGNALGSFGSVGSSNGKFYRLQGLTVGRCGNIYLCEPFQGNISVFDEDGNFITKFAEFGNEPGQLNIPMDIAFDSQDRIIISNYNKGNLELFTINDVLPSAKIMTPYVTTCQGMQADISIQLTGIPPWSITYTFNGSDPITIDNITQSPFVLAMTEAGDFDITGLTDAINTGTCVSGSASVSFHPEPTALIRHTEYSVCEGSFASIPIYFTGDGPWTFTYTHDGSNPTEVSTTHNPHILEVSDPGTYELTSIIGSNCEGSILSGTAMVSTIPLPSASFTSGPEYFHVYRCGNDPLPELEINFTGVAPWTFTYTVNDANPTEIQTFSNPYYLTAQEEGIYEMISISDQNCSSEDTYGYPDVIVRETPAVEITVTELGLCPRTTNYIPMEFTGTAPWTLSIQRNGAPPETITTSDNPYFHPVSFIGNYTVTVLSDAYCTGNPVGVSLWVRHANPPTASLPNENIILCEGMTAEIPVDFSGTGPWTFTYDIDGLNPLMVETMENPYIIQASIPGLYTMTALADANCDARRLPDPVSVVQYPVPNAGFTYFSNELQVSFSNTSLNAAEYLWDFGDGNTSILINPVHTYAIPGDYTVTLDAISEHCGTSSMNQTITVSTSKNMASGISDEENEDLQLSVYPNPSDGLFFLEINGACNDRIYLDVVSMIGQTHYSTRLNMPEDISDLGPITHELNLGEAPQGIYQLRIRCGNETISQLLSVIRN